VSESASLFDGRLTARKDFTIRSDEILLRWIVSGPAGHIEVYAPVIAEGGFFRAPRAEIHRHAFAPSPESCEAKRGDCDLMSGGDCYFTAWWGHAAGKAWTRPDAEVWEFLRYAYGREFNPETPDQPEWSR
jgi:hypothetical protein